jgi:transposase
MLHAGLDLSRRRLDYCLLDGAGNRVEVGAAAPDGDGLADFARGVELRHGPVRVSAAIESMTGARFVHDTLERSGWEVEIADATRVKGLAPLACKTDKIDAWVLAELARLSLVPAIWLPDPEIRGERERARWRLHLVKHRSQLKHRIHAQLMQFGHRCPVSDLFGVGGRQLLERLDFPDPWRSNVVAALALIDQLDREISALERELRARGAEHPYAASARRSGTCSPAINPSLRQAPPSVWPHRRPFTNCATGAKAPITRSVLRGRDREMSHAHIPNQPKPP